MNKPSNNNAPGITGTGRVEAFSDGVIAVIITIMVLELKVPHGATLADLLPAAPLLGSYALSFIFIGAYWNHHHHLFHATESINGVALWANLHVLFWLSLIPFTCGWLNESHLGSIPVAIYGFVLFMCGTAFSILQKMLIAQNGPNSKLMKAVGTGPSRRDVIAMSTYVIAIPLAFYSPMASMTCYVAVAAMYFVPDRRIESALVASPMESGPQH